jgi:hypothetical protein
MAPKRSPKEIAAFITKTSKRIAMNEQQRYEKHLAEKLQQLPVPDVESNWQQMKLLLDKQMPRGGGHWRWITGAGVLLLMLGGTWLFISRHDKEAIADIQHDKQNEVTIKEIPSKPARPGSSGKSVADEDKSIPDRAPVPESNSVAGKTDNQLFNETKTKNIEETLHNNDGSETRKSASGISDKTKSATRGFSENETVGPQKSNGGPGTVKSGGLNSGSNETVASPNRTPGRRISGKETESITDEAIRPTTDLSLKTSLPRYEVQNTPSDFEVNKLAGETIRQNYSGLVAEKNAENLKAQKSTSKTKTVKSKALASVENRTVAVGLSLPLGFPLGDQKPGPYNINAKANTVSDFLPVPHLQYHINNKVYLQTELQVANPQFIQPVLMYQDKAYQSTSTIHYNSTYAKKLYYFNVPFGIHYSPFEHFYLGTGLQFSTFISGVAMYEESSSVIGSGTTSILSQSYTKFKNDSLSSMIDNSEFRLMLDANYYWKQFTVGLRYNQALSNYVSFKLNNTTPLFTDKNKSLQFYLRYNLWENYKKTKIK